MGATNYQTTGWGKTARDAFDRARDQARAENGHQEGYSGDIQAATSFNELPLPKGVNANRMLGWIYATIELKEAESACSPNSPWEPTARDRAWLKQAKRDADKIPSQHRQQVRRAANQADTKHAPAIAIAVTGTALKDAKAANPRLPRGSKAWIFIGTAPC